MSSPHKRRATRRRSQTLANAPRRHALRFVCKSPRPRAERVSEPRYATPHRNRAQYQESAHGRQCCASSPRAKSMLKGTRSGPARFERRPGDSDVAGSRSEGGNKFTTHTGRHATVDTRNQNVKHLFLAMGLCGLKLPVPHPIRHAIEESVAYRWRFLDFPKNA